MFIKTIFAEGFCKIAPRTKRYIFFHREIFFISVNDDSIVVFRFSFVTQTVMNKTIFIYLLCGVRLIFSLFLYSFLFLLLSFFFFVIIFLLLCYYLFSNTIRPRTNIQKCDENFHCKHVLIVKDYGKLGILYVEKLGGFIGGKKEGPPP